ncbi:hypothetical protein E2C01_006324 [Portunus trituberculatus]|uniref:Uncharacterized protein n=1 Tax=Portunus trituberculatus TaxID=210409 RepID=A0A5B7CZ11_PORTR|nr:hypothetical protein [Portunus trituberculatus]
MYASMPDTITSVMHSAQRDGSLARNSNHSRENQHNISSDASNWQRQNARGISALGDPEEGLEK